MADPPRATIFPTARDFREWLEEHHDTAGELWVGYYKKGVPKTSMSYAEAVEEALCFGWIDGQVRRIDDEVVANRYTPRRRTSSWSAANLAKVAQLTAAGRMHPAGLRAVEQRDRRKDAGYSYERPPGELPAEALDRLRASPAAWAYWERQPPGYRRTATRWILDAKREATRQRRLESLIEASADGRPIKPLSS
jgi:uncharacterized protein YdeI (YjbR/CyaY-like superfamily)